MPKPANRTTEDQHFNWYRVWTIAILCVGVIILSLTTLFVVNTKEESTASAGLELKSETQQVKVGDKFTVSIYPNGRDAGTVSATQVKLNFDSKMVKLLSADSGPYYNKPLTIKWDIQNTNFAIASNPTVTQGQDPAASIIRLQFQALKSGSTNIGFDTLNSVLYVAQKGESRLQESGDLAITVNAK